MDEYEGGALPFSDPRDSADLEALLFEIATPTAAPTAAPAVKTSAAKVTKPRSKGAKYMNTLRRREGTTVAELCIVHGINGGNSRASRLDAVLTEAKAREARSAEREAQLKRMARMLAIVKTRDPLLYAAIAAEVPP